MKPFLTVWETSDNNESLNELTFITDYSATTGLLNEESSINFKFKEFTSGS